MHLFFRKHERGKSGLVHHANNEPLISESVEGDGQGSIPEHALCRLSAEGRLGKEQSVRASAWWRKRW